jgi:hypothetical protein
MLVAAKVAMVSSCPLKLMHRMPSTALFGSQADARQANKWIRPQGTVLHSQPRYTHRGASIPTIAAVKTIHLPLPLVTCRVSSRHAFSASMHTLSFMQDHHIAPNFPILIVAELRHQGPVPHRANLFPALLNALTSLFSTSSHQNSAQVARRIIVIYH